MPQHSPVLALSSWSVHRALGIKYPNAPANDVVAPAEETWGPGKLTLMELPRAVAQMGIDRLHICHFHLASRDPAYLAEIRAALADAGVSLETLLIDDGDIAHRSDRQRDIEWIRPLDRCRRGAPVPSGRG
jgi:sugar phosphate isomerase/epimerase